MCTTEQILAKDCFSDIQQYQLFDLTTDPYELYNVYVSPLDLLLLYNIYDLYDLLVLFRLLL